MAFFLEYFGVITGLMYLILEIRQHRAMWIIGFITSCIYVYVFFSSKFYADMSLNIYYVCISIYGFLQWKKRPDHEPGDSAEVMYRHVGRACGLLLSGVTALLYIILYYILSRWTDSPVSAGDAFTTALSVTATWMLAHRILEHWWVWVVINVVSLVLYYERGLYPTSFLFLCYGILAVVGWFNWKKKGKEYGRRI